MLSWFGSRRSGLASMKCPGQRVDTSWEGYAVEEVVKAPQPDEAYYWAMHNTTVAT